jgi:hypothetical protein
MKQQINEIKRMQQLAGLIKEGMESREGTVDFGPYTNVEWNISGHGTVYLGVTESGLFRQIEDHYLDQMGGESDEYTPEQEDYLNGKIDEIANEMSDYLSKQGIDNKVVDHQIGYGQMLDNLVIEISKENLAKLM